MTIHVEVVYALPEVCHAVELNLEEGATVGDAVRIALAREPFDSLDIDPAKLGVFGRPVKADRILRDGDRVEFYRDLEQDPKDQRRARAKLAKGLARFPPT